MPLILKFTTSIELLRILQSKLGKYLHYQNVLELCYFIPIRR